ncbi:MAG TPA: hypothetical protein VIS05_05085 [Ilumatobacter sp.]
MASLTGRQQWVLGAAVFVPVAIAAFITFVPRDRATRVEIADVVERYRASTVPAPATTAAPAAPNTTVAAAPVPTASAATTSVPAAPPLVAPGVYVYRTTGRESIDALGGVTHEYPAETAITIVPDGCGVLARWDALAERHEQWRLCSTPAGVELQPRALQYHEFFEQETPEDVICDVPVLLVPVGGEAAGSIAPVAQTCTLDTDPWLPVWEVLETGTREVGGERVEVRHVRMTIDDNDDYYEHYVADWWLAPDGLPVELTVVKQSRSPSVVGGVVYHEELRLELIDLDPLA